jgi:ABC-type branched-subunit amino acid transport system ATPase component
LTSVLELEAVTKTFGGLAAVQEVSFSVAEGDYLGLIGPNGAGKSTLMNLISGFLTPTGGAVRLMGQDVTDWPAWRRARLGLARTFQSNRLLPNRSVLEHLVLALRSRKSPSVLAALAGAFGRRSDIRADAMSHLELFGMVEMIDERADQLSWGHQRLLGVAMSVTACRSRPGLLLLDEPVAGMNEVEVGQALSVFRRLRESGFAIVLVEHNMSAVMSSVDRVLVIELGRRLAEGRPDEIVKDPRVIEAYLGEEQEAGG